MRNGLRFSPNALDFHFKEASRAESFYSWIVPGDSKEVLKKKARQCHCILFLDGYYNALFSKNSHSVLILDNEVELWTGGILSGFKGLDPSDRYEV